MSTMDDSRGINTSQKFSSGLRELQRSLKNVLCGRLHSLARLKDENYSLAVNAVLHETLDLFSTLVVSDCQTARHVLEYFRENKTGWVVCKLLDEIQSAPRRFMGDFVSLMDCIEVKDKQFLPLFQSLLAQWLVVDSQKEAIEIKLRCQQHQQMLNIVVKCVAPQRTTCEWSES